MTSRYIHSIFFILFGIFFFVTKSNAQAAITEQRTKIAMRKIGHELLLSSGDSTSRILPIEKENGRYSIAFETDFQLNSQTLVSTIDNILTENQIARFYLVEAEELETKKVAYSYEISPSIPSSMVACQTRTQAIGCYRILITLLDAEKAISTVPLPPNELKSSSNSIPNQASSSALLLLYLVIFSSIALFFYFRNKKQKASINPNVIPIGKYQFDKKNIKLLYNSEIIELTNKEAELLNLLYDFSNETIKREDILQKVWGDEGDYIGRTLDVFISKLRKKLSADTNIKIINIRGVGYKLLV